MVLQLAPFLHAHSASYFQFMNTETWFVYNLSKFVLIKENEPLSIGMVLYSLNIK